MCQTVVGEDKFSNPGAQAENQGEAVSAAQMWHLCTLTSPLLLDNSELS